MPFTFSHPAIILPLLNIRKRIFSSSGLIVGSIIPDFESVLRLSERKIHSHTWLGVLWYDLPLAMAVLFLYHNIARDTLIKNMPRFISRKCAHISGFKWNAYFFRYFYIVISSVLIGILSHMLWDAFTHLNLSNPNDIHSQIYVGEFRLFKILQYSNSVIGLIAIAWYVAELPDLEMEKEKHDKMLFRIGTTKLDRNTKVRFWILLAIITSVTVLIAMNLIEYQINAILTIYIVFLGLLLSLIFTPLVLRLLAVIYK